MASYIMKPDEYAKAVKGYSYLPTGAGQNYIPLGNFLTTERVPIDFQYRPSATTSRNDFVTLYSLGRDDSPERDGDIGPSNPTNTRGQSIESFQDPRAFFRHETTQSGPRSSILFLRGYMTAEWINNIGARYIVDPEFFCRHLNFQPMDDNTNNFSIPTLPSSSWHLIELPFITLGRRMNFKGPMRWKKIESLRREGQEALENHHHRIAKLASSGMEVGESMVRNFYVFDETHFALEQQITICMQANPGGNIFTLLVWHDSGSDFPSQPPLPWSTHPPESHFLPTIQHKPMIALKCHLFTSPNTGGSDLDQVTSYQQADYGRSLHPTIMEGDAFYSLTEILNLAASSQNQFLNLIDTKLDQYTSLPSEEEFHGLPSLKYTQQILYHHIQKTQGILDSIQNAQGPNWPKDQSESGRRKAAIAAENLHRNFKHILKRTENLHTRTNEAITTLMSTVSVSESQKVIKQTTRLEKLTFLAFVFVPLGFTTSFFGMNVTPIGNNNIGIVWWVITSIIVTGAAIALFLFDMMKVVHHFIKILRNWWYIVLNWANF